MFEVGEKVRAISPANDLTPSGIERAMTWLNIDASIVERYTINRGPHAGEYGYCLDIDGREFTWYSENLQRMPIQLTNDKDLLPINTFVEIVGSPEKLYTIMEVKPSGTKSWIDYRLRCQNKREPVNVNKSHSQIILLDKSELLKKWGKQNVDRGDLPNPFDNYKYQIKLITYDTKPYGKAVINSRGGVELKTTFAESFKKLCIIIHESNDKVHCDRTIAYYDGDKLVIKLLKHCKATHIKNIDNYQEEVISNLCKAKIKSVSESARLFSNKNKKSKMLVESQNDNKKFTIRSILANYIAKKTDELVNIAEIDTGEISLKFKLDDIELVIPDLRGYNSPKNRDIEKDCVCTIVNNRHLKLQKGAKVKVMEIKNVSFGKVDRYSIVSSKKYHKNSVVSALTEDNKQIICRIKNLRRI